MILFYIVLDTKISSASESTKRVIFVAYNFSFMLAAANSFLNPIIYAWKNQKFRRSFLELLCRSRTNSLPDQDTAA